ncbi:MAG: hypothetical protein AAF826_07940 [Pseudomonadota bacterium]
MAVIDDIVEAHRAPSKVMSRQLQSAGHEILNLTLALAVGFLTFVSAIPRTIAEANLTDVPVPALLLPTAFGALAILPILLYGIAALQRSISKLLGFGGTGAGARRAVFWAFMVSMPWVLAHGLLGDIIPNAAGLVLALMAFCVFSVTWIVGIRLNEAKS